MSQICRVERSGICLKSLNLLCFFCNTRHRISGALVRPDSEIYFVFAMAWLVCCLRRSGILKRILIPPFPGSNPGAPASTQVINITVAFAVLAGSFCGRFARLFGDRAQPDLQQRRFRALSLSRWSLKSLAGHFVVDFLGAETPMAFAEWPPETTCRKLRFCSQRNPSCVRCSCQSAGSRDARRINVMALSCCGCRPLTIAAVISGASQGRRSRL